MTLAMSIAAQTQIAGTRISAAYMRVSTEEQDLSLQEDAIRGAGANKTYIDKESGMNVSRLAYVGLCRGIREGKIGEVVVYRLDRLGRDPVELVRFFFELLERHDVLFRSLTEPWLSRWNQGPMEFLMWWQQVGYARFELLLLKDRQKRGIAAARARGKHLGRPRKT